MDEKKEEEFLKLVGSKIARDILKYINEHSTAQHADLNAFINVVTLNTKLVGLLEFGLIEHHLNKKGVRKEWYVITDKGKKILKHLDDMVKLVNSYSDADKILILSFQSQITDTFQEMMYLSINIRLFLSAEIFIL